MSAVKTLRNLKTERLLADPVPRNLKKTAEPDDYCLKCPTCRARLKYPDIHDCRECRDLIDGQRQDGVPDEEILTMPEIVAICKEARAERYERNQKNAACR
jgi:hypothetical protein